MSHQSDQAAAAAAAADAHPRSSSSLSTPDAQITVVIRISVTSLHSKT